MPRKIKRKLGEVLSWCRSPHVWRRFWIDYRSVSRTDNGIFSSVADRKAGYNEACRFAADNDEAFNNFRRVRPFTTIIDNVNKGYAEECIKQALIAYPNIKEYFEKFKSADYYGRPVLYTIGRYGGFSGATTRYIYYLAEMIKLFGSLNGTKIIEIGGGFGGQCKIINDYFKPASYTIVDLPDTLRLAARYLGNFNLQKVSFLTQKELSDRAQYDLVISNYAFTECVKDVQKVYINKVFKNSKRGFLKCNFMLCDTGFDRFNKEDLINSVPGSRELPHIPYFAGCFTWTWCAQ